MNALRMSRFEKQQKQREIDINHWNNIFTIQPNVRQYTINATEQIDNNKKNLNELAETHKSLLVQSANKSQTENNIINELRKYVDLEKKNKRNKK